MTERLGEGSPSVPQSMLVPSTNVGLAIIVWGVGLECAACEWLGLLPTQSPKAALIEVLLLIAAPGIWLLSGRRQRQGAASSRIVATGAVERTTFVDWWQPICVGVLAFAMCAGAGLSLQGLPPSIHDEYSYLFQAKTFLAGRLWFPSHPVMPELFDQMHVLNEGRFASRYFPGTALWLAPFVSLGKAWLGEWTAMSLAAATICVTARTLVGRLGGLVAGLVVALAPGTVLFGNRLLSHGPTTLGLSIFLLGMVRLRQADNARRSEENGGPGPITRRDRLAWGFAAGAGLCFAMLCRPLTAAAVALPWGLSLIWPRSGLTGESWLRRIAWEQCGAVALPVAIGLAGLFFYNREITGDGWTTPYSLYNQIYTPRHVYGFHNGDRGDRQRGPKVLATYDRWAANLTLARAFEDGWTRWERSWLWTLGSAPLAMSFVAVLGRPAAWRNGAGLVGASILSLNAAYWPYWYEGIDGWHYVFETLPLWGLVCGMATAEVCRREPEGSCRWRRAWWCVFIAVAAIAPYVSSVFGSPSEFDTVLARAAARRRHFRNFQELVAAEVAELPALVLIEQPQPDFHVDFVVNDPALNGAIVYGRFDPAKQSLAQVQSAFPDRSIYLYKSHRRQGGRLVKVDRLSSLRSSAP